MPACGVPAALEHVEEAGEIGIGIGGGIDQGMAPHAGLRREMHDMGKAVGCEQSRQGLRSAMSIRSNLKVKRLERATRALLQARIVSRH